MSDSDRTMNTDPFEPDDIVEARSRSGDVSKQRGALPRTAEQDHQLLYLSHELRSPLNCVLGYCELLLEDLDALDKRQIGESLTRIRDAGLNLRDILGDMVDLTRLQAGKLPLSPEPVDLGTLIRDLTAELAREGVGRFASADDRCDAQTALDPALTLRAFRFLLGTWSRVTDGTTEIRWQVEPSRIQICTEARASKGADELIALTEATVPKDGDRACPKTFLAVHFAKEALAAQGGGLTVSRRQDVLEMKIELPNKAS